MKIRRIVMGEPVAGMSVFSSIEEVPRLPLGPTAGRHYVWGCDELPQYPFNEAASYEPRSHFPPVGGLRVFVEEFPAGRERPETPEQEQGRAESNRLIAAESQSRREGSRPGMHQTDGLDIGIVISGKVTVEAEDGSSVTMGAGDIYIQPGALHAWSSDPDDPAVVAFVVLHRDDPRPGVPGPPAA
jgi:quercetin dioxygenase-like cupin family protein